MVQVKYRLPTSGDFGNLGPESLFLPTLGCTYILFTHHSFLIGEVNFCMTADVRKFCQKTIDKKSPKTQTNQNKQVQDQHTSQPLVIHNKFRRLFNIIQ